MRPAPGVSTASAPHGLTHPLHPLRYARGGLDAKPLTDAPAFLDLDVFRAFLLDPGPKQSEQAHAAPAPVVEDRTHVAICDAQLTAADGLLFTAGRLVFDVDLDSRTGDLGLAVASSGVDPAYLDGLWRLGGKGSHAAASRVPVTDEGDHLKAEALEAVARSEGRLRWVLVSPARFEYGWRPDFLNDAGIGTIGGIPVRLRAAAVSRAHAYAGWDLAAKGAGSAGRGSGGQRPTRLFVPAGSVYFLEVDHSVGDEEARGRCARSIAEQFWQAPLCSAAPPSGPDDPHRRAAAIDAASGLGRGVFGPWDWFDESEGVPAS